VGIYWNFVGIWLFDGYSVYHLPRLPLIFKRANTHDVRSTVNRAAGAMPFTSFMSPDEDAAKVAPKEKVGPGGQMWVEKQQADDSFTMIPTYSYRS
jgi:hypothetical protein